MTSSIQLDLATRIARNGELMDAEMDSEVVLLHPENSKYYCLNHSSSEIWRFLSESRRISEVCSFLQTEFAIDDDSCRREVLDHVAELVRKDVLHTVSHA